MHCVRGASLKTHGTSPHACTKSPHACTEAQLYSTRSIAQACSTRAATLHAHVSTYTFAARRHSGGVQSIYPDCHAMHPDHPATPSLGMTKVGLPTCCTCPFSTFIARTFSAGTVAVCSLFTQSAMQCILTTLVHQAKVRQR